MTNNINQTRAVFVTALPLEYEAVRNFVSNLEEEVHPKGTIYECGNFVAGNGEQWQVILVPTGKGNVRAGIETERAIDHFKPRIVIFVGVGGGVKDVKLGDVVVATTVYAYDFGKADDEYYPRPEIGKSSYRLTKRAEAEARKPDWRTRLQSTIINVSSPTVYVEPIAAGEKVIASTRSATYKLVRKYYSHALAVDMEGYGFLEATHANDDVRSLLVRGISDLLDKKETSDKEGWQPRAAHVASAFAFEVLSKLNSQQLSNQSSEDDTYTTNNVKDNLLLSPQKSSRIARIIDESPRIDADTLPDILRSLGLGRYTQNILTRQKNLGMAIVNDLQGEWSEQYNEFALVLFLQSLIDGQYVGQTDEDFLKSIIQSFKPST